MMILGFHGGKCCGIKHIHGLGYQPLIEVQPAIEEKVPEKNADQYGHTVSSYDNFFTDTAPAETTLERFDRYLAFCDKRRPYGIIEVTVIRTGGAKTGQVDTWRPYLEERGFKEVSNCHNSNSGNRVFVFHRMKDKETL